MSRPAPGGALLRGTSVPRLAFRGTSVPRLARVSKEQPVRIFTPLSFPGKILHCYRSSRQLVPVFQQSEVFSSSRLHRIAIEPANSCPDRVLQNAPGRDWRVISSPLGALDDACYCPGTVRKACPNNAFGVIISVNAVPVQSPLTSPPETVTFPPLDRTDTHPEDAG